MEHTTYITYGDIGKELRTIVQMVHQGDHTEQDGTWRDCPRPVCARLRLLIEDVIAAEKESDEHSK